MNNTGEDMKHGREYLESLGDEVWRYDWGFVVSDGEMAAFWLPTSDDPAGYNDGGNWTGWTTSALRRTEELERMLADGVDPTGKCHDINGRLMGRSHSIPINDRGEPLSYVVTETLTDGVKTTAVDRFYLTAGEAVAAAADILGKDLSEGHDGVSVRIGYDESLRYSGGGKLSEMPDGHVFDVSVPGRADL
ncbi:MAG: hypothetical protein Q4Q62_00915 [Thermoplasmata archaeon]|nr:hypothetical protein [Thermoplasmata archaeon]